MMHRRRELHRGSSVSVTAGDEDADHEQTRTKHDLLLLMLNIQHYWQRPRRRVAPGASETNQSGHRTRAGTGTRLRPGTGGAGEHAHGTGAQLRVLRRQRGVEYALVVDVQKGESA